MSAVSDGCFEAIERGDIDAAVASGADGAPDLLRALAPRNGRAVVNAALQVVARTAPIGDEFVDAVGSTQEADPIVGLRTDALAALCRHSELARQSALATLADPAERERVSLIRSLTDRDLDFAVGGVLDLLSREEKPSPSVLPQWACRYVVQVGGPAGTDAVAALLSGPHRDYAAEVLAEVQDSRGLDRLLERWRDGQFVVATSIGKLGDPRAVPALCEEMTRDRGNRTAEWRRQHWGANALAAIGDTSALPTLYQVRLPEPQWAGPSDDPGTSIRADARDRIEQAIRTLEALSRRSCRVRS